MRLKSLEVVGFKSFVDKTIINFEGGITGIVGPNGCGKSNLVDAIRWVMGEQSAKHLRGNSMEDVIFNGSDMRQGVNMAQVFLTFDASDGRVPPQYAQFSEIEIGRRLYRTGESEYFINRTPCRLKDIVDLFLDAGVSAKTYSIVEQGTIGEVVSARPEDRRILIEEAAGIAKFKLRKEAALRKIESTQANLLRLTDILNELQRQINSLNRQAKKAERYQRLMNELREHEIALSLYRYDELSSMLNILEGEKAARTESESLLSAELSKFEAEVESMKTAAYETERELESIQEELYATNQSIKLCESEIVHKTKQVEEIKSRSVQLEEDLIALNEKLKMLSWKLDKANEEKIKADCSVASLGESASLLENEVNKKRLELSNLNEKAEEKRRQLMSDSALLTETKTRFEHLDKRLSDITAKITKDQGEIEIIDRRRMEFTSIISQYEHGVEGIKKLKSQIDSDMSFKEEELCRAKGELRELEQTISEVIANLNVAKSKLESIEEMRKNLDGYREGVKNIILKSKEAQEDLKGIIGTVSETIEIEPAYETAVSAVLGERLQYVVVESHNEGIQAIEYLKKASNGRGSFIPLNVRMQTQHTVRPEGDGIVGMLTDYVRFSENYNQITNYLLGGVVVVENLRKALSHWEKDDGRYTYVTLEGDLISPSGVISGGITGDSDFGLIAQRRRIKELKEEISSREQELAHLEKKAKKQSDLVKSLEQELEEAKRTFHTVEIKLIENQHDLEEADKELKRLDSEHDRLVVEIAALSEEKNQIEQERTATILKIEQLEGDKKELESLFNELLEGIAALTSELSLQEKKLVEIKISLAQAEIRQSSIGREIEQIINAKSETMVDIGKKQDEIINGKKNIEILKIEIEQARESIQALAIKIEKLSVSQRELQNRYQTITQEMQNRELNIREIRSRRDEALSASHETALKLTELREKIHYLVNGIKDRYRIDLTSFDRSTIYREINVEEEESKVIALKERVDQFGSVNVDAIKEYEELYKRHQFISKQHADLSASLEALKHAITKINRISRQRFKEAFENVNRKFEETFPRLFEGGRARLILTDEDNLLETGVDIIVQPPGKRLQSISLLSGGEKALTAVAFVFAVFLTKPSPFCLLDEVDASLDDANIDRFNNMLRSMAPHSQFVLITHNKRTMELADTLYGVTMDEPGVSKIASVRLSKEMDELASAVA